MKKKLLIFSLCLSFLTSCNTAAPISSTETETAVSSSETVTPETIITSPVTETSETTAKAIEESEAVTPLKKVFAANGKERELSENEWEEVEDVFDGLKNTNLYYPKAVGETLAYMTYTLGDDERTLFLKKGLTESYVTLDEKAEYEYAPDLEELFERYCFSDTADNREEYVSPEDRLVGLSVECDEPTKNEDYLNVARQLVGKWLDSLKDEEGEYKLKSYAFTDDIGENRVFQGDGYVNGGREFVCYVGFDASEDEDTVFYAAGTYDTFYHYYFGPGVLARFRWENGVCTLIDYDSAFALLTSDGITDGLYGIGKTETEYKTFYDFMNDSENVEEWLNNGMHSHLCSYRVSHNVMQLTNGMIVYMDIGTGPRPKEYGVFVESDMSQYYYDSEGDAKYSSPVDFIDGSGAVVMKYRKGFSVLFDDYNHDGNPDYAIRINSDIYGSTYDIRCMDCSGTPWEDSMEIYLYDQFDESIRLQVSDSGKILTLDYNEEGGLEYKEIGFTDKSNASREKVSPEAFMDYRMYSQKFFLPEELRAYETGESEIICYFWNNTNEAVTAGGKYSIQRKNGSKWETVVSDKRIDEKTVGAQGYTELSFDGSEITDDGLSLYRIKTDVNGKTIYGGFYMGNTAKAELIISSERYPEGSSEVSVTVKNNGIGTIYPDAAAVYRDDKLLCEIPKNKLAKIESGSAEAFTVSKEDIKGDFTAGKYSVVVKAGETEALGKIEVIPVPKEALYYFPESTKAEIKGDELILNLTNNVWNKKNAVIGLSGIMVLKDGVWYTTTYISNDYYNIDIPYRKTEKLVFTNSNYALNFLRKNFEELKESEYISEEERKKMENMTYEEYVREVLGFNSAEAGDLCRIVISVENSPYTEYVYFNMP